jgi:hypothetical protein
MVVFTAVTVARISRIMLASLPLDCASSIASNTAGALESAILAWLPSGQLGVE